MDAAGSVNLQSGFVLAAILFAVFFAERLGGSEQLARRMHQVALGVTVAFLVISGTTAFLRVPDVPSALQDEAFGDSDGAGEDGEELDYFGSVSERNSEATTIHAGMGLILVAAGLGALRRWKTPALGFALGGLLLVLFGGVQSNGSSGDPVSLFFGAYASLLGTAIGPAGQARDIAHFAVLLAGTAALGAFGFWRWERGEGAPV